jgi:hypothetical protein
MTNRLWPIKRRKGWAPKESQNPVVTDRDFDEPIEMPEECNAVVQRDGTRVWISDEPIRRKKDVTKE